MALTQPTDEQEAPFRILDLPPEIVANIFEQLDDDASLIAARQVSRAFREHSTTAFGTRFFRQLIVILHPTSLAVFLEICRHDVLSKFVRQVTVSGELIGVTIFPMKTDMRPHLAQQSSVARSGMDGLILIEAFRNLSNLSNVRIDVASFDRAEDYGYSADGIKCGRSTLFLDTAPLDLGWLSEDLSYSPVYDVVLQSLRKADVQRNVKLALQFHGVSHENSWVPYFDVRSSDWINIFSKNVQEVSCLGAVDFVWLENVLQSAPGLRIIDLMGDKDFVSLPSALSHDCLSATLYHLTLDSIMLRHAEFLPFLRAHSSTLAEIHLQAIGFPDGNWIEPLNIIKDMARTERLFLNMLLESESYGNADDTSIRCDKHESNTDIDLSTSAAIAPALAALCKSIRSISNNYTVTDPDGRVFSWKVDLWQAQAQAQATESADILYQDVIRSAS
jgi:hypothetical protein